MRRWVAAGRREYAGGRAAALPDESPNDDGTLPTRVREAYGGLVAVRVRRTVATDRDDGIIAVTERVDASLSTAVIASIAGLAMAGLGFEAAHSGWPMTDVAIGYLLLAAVPAVLEETYTSLRDKATAPVDRCVRRASSDALHPWLLCIIVCVVPAAAAPDQWQSIVATALSGLALLPLVGPPWRGWTAAADWFGGWTTISESVGTVPLPVGSPGRGGATEKLRLAAEAADLELLVDRGASDGKHDPVIGTWPADEAPVRYTWMFVETTRKTPDGSKRRETALTQRVAVPRMVYLVYKFALRAILLAMAAGGVILIRGGVTVAAVAPPGEAAGSLPTLSTEAASSVMAVGLWGLCAMGVVTIYTVAIGPTWVRLLRRPNPLRTLKREDYTDIDDIAGGPAAGYRHVTADFDMLLAAPAAVCLLVGFFTGRPRLALAGVGLLGFMTVVSGAALVDGRPHLRLRQAIARFAGGTPLATRYVRLVGAAVLPLVLVGLTQLVFRAAFGVVELPGAAVLLDFLVAASFVLFAGALLVAIHDEAAPAGRFTARQKQTSRANVAAGVAALAACSLATYAGLAFVVDLWLLDLGLVDGPGPALWWSSVTATLLFVAVPASTVVGALWDLSGRTGPPTNADRLGAPSADDIDAPVYVRPTDDVVVEAVAPLWGPDYVLVSTGLLDKVKDPGERRALLAHEQSHLDYGDARLGLVLPVVGALTLTGRNVLFDLYNIRTREHRADLTAARSDIATPNDVVDVLTRLDDLDDRIEASRATAGAFGAAAAPFRSIGSDAGLLPAPVTRTFALFFGTFALTGVHPTFAERRKRVRRECGLDGTAGQPARAGSESMNG